MTTEVSRIFAVQENYRNKEVNLICNSEKMAYFRCFKTHWSYILLYNLTFSVLNVINVSKKEY